MKKLNLVRTMILAGVLLLQLSALCLHSRGAAGDVDLSFDPGLGVNGPVSAIALQPDGKVLIGGEFTTVKGLLRTNLARLNADGSGDATFNPSTPHKVVSSLALQPDGKVLVGSQSVHTECDDWDCYDYYDLRVTRLNADGSLDGSFVSATAMTGDPYDPSADGSVVVQSDGKVLIGGHFSAINGTYRNSVARLNANGSLDASFNPGTGPDNKVTSVALQTDGKIVIGGYFSAVNGTNRNGIARLNANGSLDATFNPGTGVGVPYWVASVAVQPDSKVLIGGNFDTGNGTNRHGIARLNANGSLDGSFDPGGVIGDYPNRVGSIVLQSDGKVLIGLSYLGLNGTNRNGITRLNANGSLDTSFNTGTTGSVVAAVALLPNGQVFIGGSFTRVNGTNRNRIARLHADGSLDGSFHPGTGVDSPVFSLLVQPDGKALLARYSFNTFDWMALLSVDGSPDGSFIPSSFPTYNIGAMSIYDYSVPTAVAMQSDGKVLIGGYTVRYFNCDPTGCDRSEFPFLYRFNPNGSWDGSFNAIVGTEAIYPWDPRITSIGVQSDGKVLIVGSFIRVNGTNRNGIARFNSNGSLDSSFNPGAGVTANFFSFVSSAVVQSDGKVLIGGSFASVNGTNRNRIARLNAHGSLDLSFNSGAGVSGGVVSSIVLQSDGNVLIGGSFTAVNGTNCNHIARLNADGSLDLSFNSDAGTDALVRVMALQPDGNVLIGGDFLTVNGVLRPYVARLYGDSVIVPSLNIARSNAFVIVSWPASATGYSLQESTNLALGNSWSPVAQSPATNAGQAFVIIPATGNKFFRLKSQ